MATIDDIVQALFTTLKADAALKSYCTTTLVGSLHLFNAHDDQSPPPENESPYVILEANGPMRRDDNAHYYAQDMRITAAIVDGGRVTTGNVTTYSGVEKINDFSEIVERIITTYMYQNHLAAEQGPAETRMVFPWFYWNTTLTFSHIRSII